MVLCLLALAASALATPARVILIRHGEKPDDGPELNARGWQRAEALVGFFEHDPVAAKLGAPTALFAMAPKGPDGSVRAVQTLTPLSNALGVKIDSRFKKNDVAQAAAAVLAAPDGAVVAVCWEHSVIPSLLKALGWSGGPSKWPGGDVYDRAWILDFEGGKPAAFVDAPQHLLPGDSRE